MKPTLKPYNLLIRTLEGKLEAYQGNYPSSVAAIQAATRKYGLTQKITVRPIAVKGEAHVASV